MSASASATKLITCSNCRKQKQPGDFSKTQRERRLNTKSSPNGNVGYCKECVREADTKRRYKLDAEGFDALLKKQGGKCAIPFCTIKLDETNAQIDHDHHSGKVRGLLCVGHNTSIGGLGDRIDKLLTVACYLARSTSTVSDEMDAHLTKDITNLIAWHASLPRRTK